MTTETPAGIEVALPPSRLGHKQIDKEELCKALVQSRPSKSQRAAATAWYIKQIAEVEGVFVDSQRRQLADGIQVVSTSPARYFPGILARRNPAQEQSPDAIPSPAMASVDAAENVTDETLLIRLQDKDIEALGLLYRRYARLVYSICLRILKNSTEAEDLVHEVFLCLYRKCKSFDAAKGAARSWIIQLAYCKCFDWRDYLTARNRYQVEEEGIENKLPDSVSRREETDPAYLVLWNPRMLAAFKSLSEEQQAALNLFYFQGFTFQEIADEQGYSYGNAKHHVYRGIERLRTIVFDVAGRQAKSAGVPELESGPQELAG